MAASKLFHLSSSLFRAHRRSFISLPIPLRPPPPPRPSPISTIRPLAASRVQWPRFCSITSAAALDGNDEVAATAAAVHPWPEWDHFLDKLRSKGYFTVEMLPLPDDGEDAAAAEAAFSDRKDSRELNRVKNACLKFARERFDLLRSLPKEDIQAVVECGCPNLYRKAVNSAKRLRAFLMLDEADVCGDCNLKGSCDKAYVTKEDEAARTVDIMRILLSYAVNPAALLGPENPPVKIEVQESARKLLSELIKLSDTTIDPSLPKPTVQSSSKTEPSKRSPSKKEPSRDADNVSQQNSEMKRGDWLCSNCNFHNFARNVRCLECKEDGPKRVNFSGAEMKLGDWTCAQCEYMNFARNKQCIRCKGGRPKRELNPGEWECPSCDFVNFRRNKVCLKCNHDRPHEEGSPIEDHRWRKPKLADRNSNFKFGDDEASDNDDREDVLPVGKEKSRFFSTLSKVNAEGRPARRAFSSKRGRAP